MASSESQSVPLGPQTLQPAVLEPAPSVLQRLGEASRFGLERVLSEPCEYIPHPSFSEPGIARALFGTDLGAEHAARPWCNAADIDWTLGSPAISPNPLSATEEKTLFLRLNYARYRMYQVFSKFAGRRLTERATREVLWWHAKVVATRCQIVQANLPLVLAMAKRTRLGNIDYAELISEGNMALLRSVEKFDCGRGFKFSTYACRAILKSFSRVAMRTGRYRRQFPMEFDPTLERSNYAEELRVQQEADCVDDLRGILVRNMADLNEVEATVIRERFALNAALPGEAGVPKTLEQVGLIIGVTKERVRQIQNRALLKLRMALQEEFLAA